MIINQRLDALTSLRFFAAAMIVVDHVISLDLFGFDKGSPTFLPWGLGVSFFFVLSGFILTYIYPKLDTWQEIRRFWRARIARIWPALFASFVLAIWLLSLDWDYKTAIVNLLMVNAWIPYPNYFLSYNAPSWSISTEFFFYLSFPYLINRWEKNWQIKFLASGLILITLISMSNLLKLPPLTSIEDQKVTSFALLYINPLSRIYEFIFGMVVATYWRNQVKYTQWSIYQATLYEIGVILLAVVSMHYISSITHWVDATWLGAGTSNWLYVSVMMSVFGLLIYVMAIGRGWIASLLSHPSIVLLGEISFSIYLLHAILLRYYFSNIGLFPKLPNMISLAIYWTVLLLASYVMWSLFEMPCRRLILGRWQKNLHGTKVMWKSWHSHLNLNRKTLFAAAVLFCVVTTINFTFENNPNRITEAQANELTPKNLKFVVGTRFGDLFLLRGVRIVRDQEGLNIYLAWESLVKQELKYNTRIILTDINGKAISNINVAQPRTRKDEEQGAIWGRRVFFPADKLNGLERRLAIVVYQGDSIPLHVDRGIRDWGGHRLIIDLNYAM